MNKRLASCTRCVALVPKRQPFITRSRCLARASESVLSTDFAVTVQEFRPGWAMPCSSTVFDATVPAAITSSVLGTVSTIFTPAEASTCARASTLRMAHGFTETLAVARKWPHLDPYSCVLRFSSAMYCPLYWKAPKGPPPIPGAPPRPGIADVGAGVSIKSAMALNTSSSCFGASAGAGASAAGAGAGAIGWIRSTGASLAGPMDKSASKSTGAASKALGAAATGAGLISAGAWRPRRSISGSGSGAGAAAGAGAGASVCGVSAGDAGADDAGAGDVALLNFLRDFCGTRGFAAADGFVCMPPKSAAAMSSRSVGSFSAGSSITGAAADGAGAGEDACCAACVGGGYAPLPVTGAGAAAAACCGVGLPQRRWTFLMFRPAFSAAGAAAICAGAPILAAASPLLLPRFAKSRSTFGW
mmetsp:Transcript_39227/g.122739  ORF Transcript_39227/g.122739 Transcript_39227/m.122739 type:complete len:417 (+) Transcript_39227:14-1264(+)